MKRIEIRLTSESLNSAVRELESYESELEEKIELLKYRIATELQDKIQSAFARTTMDIPAEGGYSPIKPDVSIYIEEIDGELVVCADGDAVWVEFGTGVYFNGQKGTSPHPKGSELGFTIGDFGHKQGRRLSWKLPQDKGGYLVAGTPAQMPIWKACTEIRGEVVKIAKEVFRNG